MKTLLVIITALFLAETVVLAANEARVFRLAKIFSDGLVLQQEKPVTIWGWADPGAEVAVTLTRDAAAGEAAVARAEGEETRRNKNAATANGYSVAMRYVERNPPAWPTQATKTRAKDDGRWKVTFEAVPASFQPAWIIVESGGITVTVANVLVGEVWVCAGQSNMAMKNFDRKSLHAPSSDCPGLRYIAWNDSWYEPLEEIRPNASWRECTPETAGDFSAVPYLYGMFLHRYLKVPVGIINVARGGTTGDAWCLRGELDQLQHVTVEERLRQYDAETAIWDDPQNVERIMNDWEKQVAEGKARHENELAQAKAEGKPEPRMRLPKQPEDPRSGWSPPAGLFNATVMPIRDLGVRGVLYYQGENNVFNCWTRYEHTFPKVPVSFRKAFDNPELPFGCISQPGWGAFGTDPEVETVTGGYAIIRDIQRRALKGDPHAGMIATYPTGNSNIHPGEKYPVAEYASLWALAKVYGKPVVHRGNEYRKMVVKDGKAYVYFDTDLIVHERWKHIKDNASWQVLPQPRQGKALIEGFIIAGDDQRWYPAKAREMRLDGLWAIEVWSDLVDKPVAVRYGWANWPTGNLVGSDRLPVPTFRTDDWPIIEGVSYSSEAKQAAIDQIKTLQAQGAKLAMDRKIRQMEVDLPVLESELYSSSVDGQLRSKLQRIEKIFADMQTNPWLSSAIQREHPELTQRIEALREKVSALRSTLPEN